jgi:hypothetical protein
MVKAHNMAFRVENIYRKKRLYGRSEELVGQWHTIEIRFVSSLSIKMYINCKNVPNKKEN